jgi:hypothetical protein
MCTNNPFLLFNIHIHGLAGYIAGAICSHNWFCVIICYNMLKLITE